MRPRTARTATATAAIEAAGHPRSLNAHVPVANRLECLSRVVRFMPHAPVPTPDAIIALYHAGELAVELAKYHEAPVDADDAFAKLCVDLHNSGQIDLLAVPSQLQFATIAGHNFFVAQQIYCEAIPDLKASASSLMECCRVLVERGGNDLASNQPNVAFRKWCENNPSEGETVIASARNGDELARRFVTFALQASENVDEAVNFIAAFDDDRRLFGMAGLAGMNFTDAASAKKALDALEPFVSSDDDNVRGNALHAAFEVLKRTRDEESGSRLAVAATLRLGPATLHCLTHVIWLHHALLNDEAFQAVTVALEHVPPENLGTIRDLDIALHQLLGTPRENLILQLLTAKLADGRLTLENFQSTAGELRQAEPGRLYQLIVSWLLTGNLALCDNLHYLIRFGDKHAFQANIASLGLSAAQQVFVCRKAIGFLFTSPVACSSILVSVLRGDSKDAIDGVAELLFDPLLVNYGGEAVDYLKSIPTDDPAHVHVQKALKRHEAYIVGLKGVGVISELHPSEYQRDVVNQKSHDLMRSAQKEAEGKSVFLNLVHRSTILYGKRSLTYIFDDDGSSRPVAMDLHSTGVSFEMPRHEIVDPVGLDLMLRVLRIEKPE